MKKAPTLVKHNELLKQQTLTVDGIRKTYWLLKPSPTPRLLNDLADKPTDGDGHLPLPLIVVLHGAFMSSTQMMYFSELSDLAEAQKCFLVYPDMSYIWQWDVPSGFANKDATFIEYLIKHLCKTLPIDSTRIYATGFSSGADILHLLACSKSLSSMIAAFVPVCSNLDRDWAQACEHECPTSIMMINGTDDKFNRWEGDSKRWMSVKDTFTYWQTHNKITATSESLLLPNTALSARESRTKAHLLQSFEPNTGSEVSLVTIEGGGHTWPGDRPDKWYGRLLLGHRHKEQFAHSLIWKFFERHQLKAPRPTAVH